MSFIDRISVTAVRRYERWKEYKQVGLKHFEKEQTHISCILYSCLCKNFKLDHGINERTQHLLFFAR